MSDWEFLIDAVRELYLPKLKDEGLSIEEFTALIGKTTSLLDVAAHIAEEGGEKEVWEEEGQKIWGELAGSPAGRKYFERYP